MIKQQDIEETEHSSNLHVFIGSANQSQQLKL
jgi:hypothetical protein